MSVQVLRSNTFEGTSMRATRSGFVFALFFACTPSVPGGTTNNTGPAGPQGEPGAPGATGATGADAGTLTGTAALSGKVVLTGVSDASGVVVTLVGPATRVALSAADGTYAFTALPGGFYQVAAEVVDSLERRQVTAASLTDGAGTAADLTFTVTGSLSGHVTHVGAGDIAGATVAVLGTDKVATTDTGGLFSVHGLVLGGVTVSASAPGFVTNTAAATVVRGSVASAAIGLDRAGVTLGSVQGRVAYFGASDMSTVTLTLIGGANSSAAIDGSYTIAAPPGTYELVADAPTFPRNKIATVTLIAGVTIDVGEHFMSLYRRVGAGQLPLGVQGSLMPGPFPVPIPPHPAVTKTGILIGPPVGGPGATNFALIDPSAGRGVSCVAPPLAPVGAEQSPDGEWLLFNGPSSYVVLNAGSCEVITTTLTTGAQGACHFRSDSNAVVCLRSSTGLMTSLDFRTGIASAMTAAIIPSSSVTRVKDWDLVIGRNGANASLLSFNPLGETLLSATALNATPSVMTWGGTDLQPFSSTAVLLQACPNCVAKIVHPDGSVLTTAALTGVGAYGDVTSFGTWFGYDNGGRVNLVRVSDGATVTGNAGSTRALFVVNDSGTRAVFTGSGPNTYVDSLTPGMTLSTSDVLVAGVALPPPTVTWLSDTRLFATSNPTTIHLKTAGAPTVTETPVTALLLPAGPPFFAPPTMPVGSMGPFQFSSPQHVAVWKRPGNVLAVAHRDAPIRTQTVAPSAFTGPWAVNETPDHTLCVVTDFASPTALLTIRAAVTDAGLTLIDGFTPHFDFVTNAGMIGIGPTSTSHVWIPHSGTARFNVWENFVTLPPATLVPSFDLGRHPSLSLSTADGGAYSTATYSAYFP
ncbi:MAG: hypothetical protein IT381_02680 [Deltaproteobacteria bacterium]|nr:hypothetical protein [Deltaproteobacteria bacterium]